jgi:hypothetical protein
MITIVTVLDGDGGVFVQVREGRLEVSEMLAFAKPLLLTEDHAVHFSETTVGGESLASDSHGVVNGFDPEMLGY